MSEGRPQKIKPHHVRRLAIIYVRQSDPQQVLRHKGSTDHQRGQRQFALAWGWAASALLEIADDLGVTGTSGELREGWKRLLSMVAQQLVGIILVSDPNRLSRSAADAETLLTLCRTTDTLLAIEGVVYDLNIPADRLMLRVRFDFGVFDNEDRAYRFMQAKRALAAKGHAVSLRPTGYVVVEKGKWVKDPDLAVRQALEEVFRQFRLRGTVGRVLRFFHDHGILLPVRHSNGTLRWVRATRSRIYYVLVNPAYMGAYVYGRRPLRPGAYPERDARRRTSRDDWIISPGHHEPYISPAEFERNYERLRRNRVTVRQPAGTGPALAQGVLRCGQCGRRMHVQYYLTPSGKTGSTYTCNQAAIQYGAPRCQSVHGRTLDTLVAAELLHCVDPPEVQAVLEAASDVNREYEATRRQRDTELDDARYEVNRLKKHLSLIDPEKRRLAASLEQDLEGALERLERLERGGHRAEPLQPPLAVTAEVLEAIQALARDLPGLWVAPSVTSQDRKALVRLFIQEIVVAPASEIDLAVQITWVGGGVTEHTVFLPRAGGILARRLKAEGKDEVQIAAELKRRGLQTVERQGPYTAAGVRSLLQGAARRARLAAEKRAATAAADGPAGDGGRDGGGNGTGEGGARGGEGITGGIGGA